MERGSALEIPFFQTLTHFRTATQRARFVAKSVNFLQLIGTERRHVALAVVTSGGHGIHQSRTVGTIEKETGALSLQFVDSLNVVVPGGEIDLFLSLRNHRISPHVALQFQHRHIFSRENGLFPMEDVTIIRDVSQFQQFQAPVVEFSRASCRQKRSDVQILRLGLFNAETRELTAGKRQKRDGSRQAEHKGNDECDARSHGKTTLGRLDQHGTKQTEQRQTNGNPTRNTA